MAENKWVINWVYNPTYRGCSSIYNWYGAHLEPFPTYMFLFLSDLKKTTWMHHCFSNDSNRILFRGGGVLGGSSQLVSD